jgi:hypothetical protein
MNYRSENLNEGLMKLACSANSDTIFNEKLNITEQSIIIDDGNFNSLYFFFFSQRKFKVKIFKAD